MDHDPQSSAKEQELLRHARREGSLIMVVWALALVWTMVVSYLYGYRRPADAVALIWGIPDWVFWAIVVPWGLCLVFSVWFCFAYMADDDLGRDNDEEPAGA